MTTSIRRLSINEVKSLFDCIYKNKFPPKDLQFKIVLVGSNGLKLSPPSYEYKGETDSREFFVMFVELLRSNQHCYPSKLISEGLYVLLKPDKKVHVDKHIETAVFDKKRDIPTNLMEIVMQDYPVENCPWSLSGPQFSTPSSIQQRYCYPKGSHSYSQVKGGSLWTIVSPIDNNIVLIVLHYPFCIIHDIF